MREAGPSTNPHKSLWQQVLTLAVEDALIGPAGESKPAIRAREIEDARRFLTTKSKDLSMVCSLAGLDPDAVLDRMVKRIAKAPSVAELVAAPRQRPTKPIAEPRPKRIAFKDRPFTINGTTRTAAEWAARIDIPVPTIQARLNRGWNTEHAFTVTAAEALAEGKAPLRQHHDSMARKRSRGSPAKLLTHDGMTMTIAQWAERTGLKVGTIKQRLQKGATVAQALDPRDLRGKSLEDRLAHERQAA